jgi:predicted metalloendopeptidase
MPGVAFPRGILPPLLATAILWWPASSTHAQSGDGRRPAALDHGVDSSIAPGDDFFGYANGGWLEHAQIPAGMEKWTARTEIDATTRQQVAALLDSAGAAPAGSLARKVADFRAAYLDQAAIEARGITPLKPVLDSIAQVQDKAALTRLLGRWLPADVDPLNWGIYRSSHVLGLSVEPGVHGERANVAFLLQGGLGLPDREQYLGTEPRLLALRARYQEYIGRQLTLAGFDRGEQRARAVMALETALARTQATAAASADDHNADHRWTRADFARRAPGMDWSAFFAAAGLAGQDSFVAWQPGAVTGVAALVASQPLQSWKDYLRFHLIHRYADVLPPGFADAAQALQDSAGDQSPRRSRAERAMEATQLAMGEALGRMYAERYFPAERKARVEAIVGNVIAAFARRLEEVGWMSPATRTLALAKMKTLYFGIGYPEHWQDYSDLKVDRGDALGNLRRAADLSYRRALARLGRPADMHEWWISPQTVGAVLLFQQNAYNFPAALLQPPKFDPAASDAANYGAIGAIVGHEVSHFVDLLGADWDARGRSGRWWTPEDVTRFQAAGQTLVNQVSGYKPFPDLALDGERTRTESVADLAGLVTAFDAYRRTLGTRAGDPDYVRQQDREFFLGFARSWRSTMREPALRAQIASDSHTPERYRIATVRNLDAWYDAFHVVPGQRLYLEPAARVRIW